MKKLTARLLSALCVAALLVGLLPLGAVAAEPEHTLWIVGDSTVCDFGETDAALYYPRYGYGTQIANYLDGTYTVKNLALSGRSSKSFVKEANYATLFDAANGIKAGDALIIGFGHNDEKVDDAERYTSGTGDWQTEGSFAKSLWDNYVSKAQAVGAEAILCTPIVRRAAGEAFKDSEVHVTAQGDYPQAVRKLGTDKNVAVVDLTAQTKALYEANKAETLYLHSWTNSKEGSVDNTHLNIYGAKVVARMLALSLQGGSTELGKHVVPGEAPDKATDLVVNPNYVEKEYAPPTTASKLGEPYIYRVDADTVYTFRPTAFGDLGGDPYEKPNHILETDADGNIHIAVLNNKGKIASGADGIAMYYVPVPVGKLVKLTATATVNSIGTSNPQQGAFGLMARDDMYIDSNDKTISSDYVAAGTLGNGSTNCFYRKATKLNKTTALPEGKLAAGGSYQLSLVGNPDGFTCTFDDQPPQSGGFDFALTSVDSDYYYVGLFCARNLDVTFSNISLEITGQAVNPDLPDEPVIVTPPDEEGVGVAGGWLESLYAELPGVTDADVTAVKYSGAMTGELTGDDLTYLVRDMEGRVRIDIPGLKAGKYDLTVTAADKDYAFKNIEVLAHDRSGFAHQSVGADSVCTPYTEGVGAYNDDGTLKDNATVLYVTDDNKDTVTLTVKNDQGKEITVTGIGNILNTKGFDQNLKKAGGNANTDGKILAKMASAKRPIVVRIVGEVTQPQGVTAFGSTANGGSKDDNGGMCIMEYVGNITIEGVGADATVNGWGFSFSADGTGRTAEKNNKRDGWGENIEVRNLSFRNVPEDCIGISGSQKGTDFQDSAEHVWVHNNSFYGPKGLPDASADGDKSEGDGAVDFRNGEYMTLSYNYFEGYHKTSLVGSDDGNLQYHVTWHHNWWKDVQSRSPLGRQANMHIYNNLYDGQTSYCMSLRAKVYIFSESNIFQNCNNPVVDEGSKGVCKSFGDLFTNCTGKNNAVIAAEKTQKVDSTNPFANFDTAEGGYVAQGVYKLDTLTEAKANIETWSGVMKAAPTPDVSEYTISVTGGTASAAKAAKGVSVTVTATVPEEGQVFKGWTATGVTLDDAQKLANPMTFTMPESDVTLVAIFMSTGGAGDVDKTALTAAIDAAKKAGEVYVVADDTKASTVTKGTKFVTQSVKDALDAAIAKAQTVADNAEAAQEAVDKAVDELKTATETFTKAIKTGTKGSFSGGGGSSRPTTKPTTPPEPSTPPTVVIDPNKPASENFTDVVKDSWYEDGVTYVTRKGLFQGVAQGVFAPELDMTRAMLMTVLARLDGHGTDGGETWYAKGVAWAMEKNISDGTMLDMSVTREQMVTMLYRYAEPGAVQGDLGTFADADSIHDWAREAMAWAVSQGILTGKDGKRLDPQGTATRAEVATILQRFVEKTEKTNATEKK